MFTINTFAICMIHNGGKSAKQCAQHTSSWLDVREKDEGSVLSFFKCPALDILSDLQPMAEVKQLRNFPWSSDETPELSLSTAAGSGSLRTSSPKTTTVEHSWRTLRSSAGAMQQTQQADLFLGASSLIDIAVITPESAVSFFSMPNHCDDQRLVNSDTVTGPGWVCKVFWLLWYFQAGLPILTGLIWMQLK